MTTDNIGMATDEWWNSIHVQYFGIYNTSGFIDDTESFKFDPDIERARIFFSNNRPLAVHNRFRLRLRQIIDNEAADV